MHGVVDHPVDDHVGGGAARLDRGLFGAEQRQGRKDTSLVASDQLGQPRTGRYHANVMKQGGVEAGELLLVVEVKLRRDIQGDVGDALARGRARGPRPSRGRRWRGQEAR